jgi:rhamnosyltransferase
MVTILLSTYNGEKYLNQLFESLFKQIDVEMSVLVRDDSSSDSTKEILRKYEEEGKLSWYTGENLRSAGSFMDLLFHAPDSEYYAFCDQDDVWEADKLYSAIKMLKQTQDKPSLYFSQTKLVDKDLNSIKTIKINTKCSFVESLFVNYSTGCTFVFNKKLLDLVRLYKPNYISMHDYWVYRVCLAVNGDVYFDPESHILYRQHDNNVLGLKEDFSKGLKLRLQRTIFNRDHERLFTCQELLKGYGSIMPVGNKIMLEDITNYKVNIFKRFKLLFNSKLTIGSFKQDLYFRLALLIGSY